MTLGDLIRKSHGKLDLELTVRKNDEGQTTANTTVGVSDAQFGFDFTNGQLVLIPEVCLSTHQSVVDDDIENWLISESNKNTKLLRTLAKLSIFIEQNVLDEDLKNKIKNILKSAI